MAEETISKKLHPSGSLAARVILICLVLLVIPLFLHSIYLYRTEYEEKLADIRLTLQVIGEAQIALLQERVHLQWNRLDAVDSEANPTAKKLGISAIRLPQGASGHFVLADLSLNGLVVGREMKERIALIILTSFGDLLNELTHFQNAPYPVSVAFIRGDGKMLAGEVQPRALSIQLPFKGSNFSLNLTVPVSSIADLHFQKYLYQFMTLLFFIGLLGGVLVWLLTRRIARPLRKLCHTLDRVSEGGAHIRYEADSMGFEINELGKQFNMTLDAVLKHQNEAAQERLSREKLAQELKIGREIQLGLLPKTLPDWNELDIAPGFLPATEVSGDFYDLFPLGEEKLMFVIADTAGKGISACLFALGFRSLLRSAVSVKPKLSDALLEANHIFWLDARQTGTFLTAWTGIYDRKKKILTYCSMGHPPAILKRGGQLHELSTQGIAFGATECDAITTQTISLESDDLLFLCTDGILESHNVNSERFGQKRLNEFLLKATAHSSEKIVEELLQTIQNFSAGAPQHDDITCLSIKVSQLRTLGI